LQHGNHLHLFQQGVVRRHASGCDQAEVFVSPAHDLATHARNLSVQ
jgi:hypothetical protein